MLKWSIVFLVLAVLSGVFGFGLVATSFAFAAKILFFGFLALLVISLLGQATRSLKV